MADRAKKTKKIILSGLFLALGMVLPFVTMQIKEIGDSLLPMHLVVMLCGIVCGWRYGFVVGAVLPVLRSVCFSMPPLYPNAVWMMLELATYGFVSGFIYSKLRRRGFGFVFVAIICSMLLGRIVWGVSKYILLGFAGVGFSVQMFIAGGFLDAIPGMVLQLVLIPVIIKLIERNGWNNYA